MSNQSGRRALPVTWGNIDEGPKMSPSTEDQARVEALSRYDILDTEAEQSFDDLAAIAAYICQTPMAMVTLVDTRRQWFKARIGFAPAEAPMAESICKFTLRGSGVLVIPDMTLDERTCQSPVLHGPARMRFYAGAPLVTPDGVAIGALCVIDTKARPQGLPRQKIACLLALARQAIALMELRRSSADLERKAAEREREDETMRRLYSVNRNWTISKDLLAIAGADGVLETVNPAWQDILGWSDEEVAGTALSALIHPEDRAAAGDGMSALRCNQPIMRLENRLRHANGQYRWFSWVAIHEDGKVYLSLRDTTWQRDQTRLLDETIAARDRLWRHCEDIMLVASLDMVISAVNPAWTAVLGWSESELIGARFIDYVHPDDVASTLNASETLRQGDSLSRFENRYRHKDGSYRWIAWRAAPAHEVFTGVGRDCTAERAQADALEVSEAALRQAQKMEAVGQLTAGIAHDFNNILQSISLSLEFIEQHGSIPPSAKLGRYLATARRETDKAASLTQRLLAYSRQQMLDPKPINLNRVVAGMCEMIRRVVGPTIDIEVIEEAGLWTAVIDPGQLENALVNLCINARDAMPGGGKIVIESANKWLDERAASAQDLLPGHYLSLSVTDNGTGIPAALIARVFDPFFTTKPTGQGTGLGLSMIHGFVRQSKGQVRIYSEPGSGTTVSLYFPRAVGEHNLRDVVATAMPKANQGETVLLVDDDASIRMLVSDLLVGQGYKVLEAADGYKGVKLLTSSQRIDLLITDIGLPGGMSGRQVADAGRELRPALKVLFITGFADRASVENGFAGVGEALLTKPFASTALVSRVEGMICMQ